MDVQGVDLPAVIDTPNLVLLTVGMVIGSGIFLVPGLVLRECGQNIALAGTVWLLGGVLSILGALSYAELGAMKPTVGGLYVYLREIFGDSVAFLFGWSMFFIIGSGAIATLSVAFATYAGELVPLGRLAQHGLALGLIAVVAAVNVWGTHSTLGFQRWTTWGKLLGLLGLVAVLAALGRGGPAFPSIAAPAARLPAGLALALVSTLWAYEGWQWVLFSAGEVRRPQTTLPRGLFLATLILAAIYLATNGAYLAALGAPGVAHSTRVAADAFAAVGLPVLAKLVAALIMISIAAAANGTLMTTSRVYYAMAGDGLFFRALARLSRRSRVPAAAVLASAGWAALLAWSGTFEQLLSWVVTIGWGFYGLGAACVICYRRRAPAAARPYRVPGYPVTPVVFIITAAGVVLAAAWQSPRAALMGAAFLGVGLAVDALRRRAAGRGS